jgi:hypothetical protein
MSIKIDYEVRLITNSLALAVVIEKHYLHRKAPCKLSYGLFHKVNNELMGVVIYGKPSMMRIAQSICGEEEASNVYELTRLWVDDNVPKNGESFLISNSIRLLDKEIIVSYADTEFGHVGTVYQAANFIYTGLSCQTTGYKIDGSSPMHKRSLNAIYGTIENARIALGERLEKYSMPRKHRYVIFNTDKRRKKELLSKLKHENKEYPKSG